MDGVQADRARHVPGFEPALDFPLKIFEDRSARQREIPFEDQEKFCVFERTPPVLSLVDKCALIARQAASEHHGFEGLAKSFFALRRRLCANGGFELMRRGTFWPPRLDPNRAHLPAEHDTLAFQPNLNPSFRPVSLR